MRLLGRDGRWSLLVTYADERQGHSGAIYKATNWIYHGKVGPYPVYQDLHGRVRSIKATSRIPVEELEERGLCQIDTSFKHRYIYALQGSTEVIQTTMPSYLVSEDI